MVRLFLVAALAAFAVSCRSTAPPAAIDPGMASWVLPDTVVLAGLNLSAIRSSPLYPKLAGSAEALVFPEAAQLLVAFDGKEILTIARGPFHAAPAGWTLVEPSLAISAPDNAIRAAVAQHKGRPRSPSPLLSAAASIAAGKPIWIVARGGVALPLSGNAANLNRLLRDSEFAGVTVALGATVRIEATAVGRTPDAAGDIEETLRAVLAMMAMGEKRGSTAGALLGAVEVRREDRTVHAGVSANADDLGKLLELLGR